MATETSTPPPAVEAASAAAIEAITKKAQTVQTGTVVSFGVKNPGGGRPVFSASDQDRPIYCEKTGSDTWVASWVAPKPGEHAITVSADDATSVVFVVTALKNEE